MTKPRDYAHEYATYGIKTKKQRAQRNAARNLMKKVLGEAAIKGKDIDHKRPIKKGGSNNLSNLRVRSIHSNRGAK